MSDWTAEEQELFLQYRRNHYGDGSGFIHPSHLRPEAYAREWGGNALAAKIAPDVAEQAGRIASERPIGRVWTGWPEARRVEVVRSSTEELLVQANEFPREMSRRRLVHRFRCWN